MRGRKIAGGASTETLAEKYGCRVPGDCLILRGVTGAMRAPAGSTLASALAKLGRGLRLAAKMGKFRPSSADGMSVDAAKLSPALIGLTPVGRQELKEILLESLRKSGKEAAGEHFERSFRDVPVSAVV